jgi:hypothetical protein
MPLLALLEYVNKLDKIVLLRLIAPEVMREQSVKIMGKK